MMKLDRKDLGAGAVFIAFGLLYGGIAIFGGLMNPSLPMGQALSMGPGYFPVVLSGLLIIVGGILVGRSFFAATETNFFDVISWRAIFMLSLAVMLFGAFLREMGMLLALFIATFLSALASKHITVRYAAAVAAGVAIFCVLVFGPYGVRLPIPVIGTWFVN
jgi:predicted permease